jgi:hypothetical protein
MVGVLLMAGACGDGPGFNARRLDLVAVTVGDFDNVQEPFNRMSVDTVQYDGIISTATWVEDEDDFVAPTLNVEGLFLADGNNALDEFGALFLASGTRGFGATEYNSLQADDDFISDETAMTNLRGFVRSGGVLWATDWTYDAIIRMFPDTLDFLGDESVPDDAQRGEIGEVRGVVVDEALAAALGTDTLLLTYNFSNWAVLERVADSDAVKVLVEGDVEYRDPSGEGTVQLTGVPLLVSIPMGSELGGEILYSTFPLDEQNSAVVDAMLLHLVGEFTRETIVREPGEN